MMDENNNIQSLLTKDDEKKNIGIFLIDGSGYKGASDGTSGGVSRKVYSLPSHIHKYVMGSMLYKLFVYIS